MEKNEMEAMKLGMKKIIYYNFNYDLDKVTYKTIWGEEVSKYLPSFFKDITWGCNTEHMVGKWESALDRYGNGSALLHFFCELDGGNQDLLLTWIAESYSTNR